MILLETQRLRLRNLMPEDAEVMFDYRNNEICARYQRGQTKDYEGITALVQQHKEDSLNVESNSVVAVALKDANEMIGEIVVMPNDGAISLGYTFSYKHHRNGYAFEALSALTNLLHETYPEWDFICFTEPENQASMALLTKLGYKNMGYIPQLESQMFGKWTQAFRKPCAGDIAEIAAFKQEFQDHHSGMDGTGILVRSDVEEWLRFNQEMEYKEGLRSLQYGLFRKEDNRLLGLIQIRLELAGYLIDFGGNIGYCVRPSERQKGYAKEMLCHALDICREEGLEKVLITCLEDNTASAKTIEACGGVFEKVVYDDKNYMANMKRYWIKL